MSKNILIAESGSTKTDWVYLIKGEETKRTSTIGLNPFVVNSNQVTLALNENDFFEGITSEKLEVNFYGSGCSSKKRNNIINEGIKRYLPNAEINIFHDIQAAVNSTCNGKPGIVGILGTGSNCVYFDGQTINYGHASPGYLLGDEGAGFHIGKTFLRDLIYEMVPTDLKKDFESTFHLNSSQIIDAVYSAEQPNAYIASFVSFLGQHHNHHYTEDLVHKCFAKFVKLHVAQFPEAVQAPFHCVGSVAHHFEEILTDVLEEWKIEKGNILKSPLEGLIKYHQNQR